MMRKKGFTYWDQHFPTKHVQNQFKDDVESFERIKRIGRVGRMRAKDKLELFNKYGIYPNEATDST